jgi:hypothetical protein
MSDTTTPNTMDGATKYRLISELRRELHADECTEERSLEILAEIRKLERPTPKSRRSTKQDDQYMTVLGGYVLDMHNPGRLVGYRDEHGNVRDRHTGKVIGR